MLGRFSKTAEGQRAMLAQATNEEKVLKIGMKAVLSEVTAGTLGDEDETITLVGVAAALCERVRYEKAIATRWLTKNGHALEADDDEIGDDDDDEAGDEGGGANPPPADNTADAPADAPAADDAPAEKAATTKAPRKRAAKKAPATDDEK